MSNPIDAMTLYHSQRSTFWADDTTLAQAAGQYAMQRVNGDILTLG